MYELPYDLYQISLAEKLELIEHFLLADRSAVDVSSLSNSLSVSLV